jgi:hypothetical protein
MSIAAAANWLQGLAVARFVAQAPWAFPAIETVHVIAISLVVGSIAVVDLRLLGLWWRERPVVQVADELLPWTWIAFVVAAVAGGLMFISAAVKYVSDLPFQLKMLLLVLAGVNMLIFHFGAYRRVADWAEGRTPRAAKIAASLSLVFWIAVVACGRMVSFTTQDQFGPPPSASLQAPVAG